MPSLPGRSASALCAATLLAAASGAFACGLEDPDSITLRRGMLNMSYPQALHVGTAIWQAQLSGTLPRDPIAQRGEIPPDGRALLRRVRANGLLARFASLLDTPAPGAPKFAVVLLDSVMWSRFEVVDGVVRPTIHVAAPEPGDVVIVTDTPVLDAIVQGQLELGGAVDGGLMRLYGSPQRVVEVRDAWAARKGVKSH